MMTISPDTTVKDLQVALAVEMEKPLEHLKRELVKIRTGRAHTSMVEDISANCYGTAMSLKELAVITAPEARLIVIQPWDKSNIAAIEKGILTSDLGVTPINDGELIRIQLPQISASRRDELLKLLGKKVEEARTAIRNIRKEFQNIIREGEKNGVAKDFAKRLMTTLQEETDSFIKKAEELAAKKEDDLKTA